MTHRHRNRLLRLSLILLGLCSAASASWKEKVLYSFQGGDSDGSLPVGSVVFDPSGNLYGATTYGGGRNCGNPFQCGTVYQLTPPAKKGDPWTETVLYIFKGIPSGDAATPSGGLLIDKSGNLYGATGYGGVGKCQLLGDNVGCGAVFELSPPKTQGGAWTETILYSFRGNTDGQLPIGDLVFDQQGNLYGSTAYGGGYGSCNPGFYQHCGTVFKLSPPKTKTGHWKEQVLYSFKTGKDGANPNGGLVFDTKGVLYGATEAGGNQKCQFNSSVGCGTVFSLTMPPKGGAWIEKQLHVFVDGNDGGGPNGGLRFGTDGKLYGTAPGGGRRSGGVVFQLTPSSKTLWTESVLYSFGDGDKPQLPTSGMTFDTKGNLYGPALAGKTFRGVLYRLQKPASGHTWSLTVLYNFTGSEDGHWPEAPVIFGPGGEIYSTTQGGGSGQLCQNGCGTVFEISP